MAGYSPPDPRVSALDALIEAVQQSRAALADEVERRGDEDANYTIPIAPLLERLDDALDRARLLRAQS